MLEAAAPSRSWRRSSPRPVRPHRPRAPTSPSSSPAGISTNAIAGRLHLSAYTSAGPPSSRSSARPAPARAGDLVARLFFDPLRAAPDHRTAGRRGRSHRRFRDSTGTGTVVTRGNCAGGCGARRVAEDRDTVQVADLADQRLLDAVLDRLATSPTGRHPQPAPLPADARSCTASWDTPPMRACSMPTRSIAAAGALRKRYTRSTPM